MGKGRRPRLLDLFCGEGGAAEGYIRAGFEVIGVDKKNTRKRYPGSFIHGDAIEYLVRFGKTFDVIHSSPPCQPYSIATAGNLKARAKYDRLIPTVRDLSDATGKPWVMENVALAAKEMNNPITLCGTMFGLSAVDDDGTKLEMWRHRLFESNVSLSAPGACRHGWYSQQVAGSYGGARRDKHEARNIRHGGYVPSIPVQRELLGINWMTQKGMWESIPPVYSEYVGRQLLDHLS